MTIKQFNLTLEDDNVEEAKGLQKEISGATNISGLLNSLLKDWIGATKRFIAIKRADEHLIKEEFYKYG